MMYKRCLVSILLITLLLIQLRPQSSNLKDEVEQVMLRATKFMVEEVSTNGGYLWYYLPDFSRRWGEMEAYKTMIWLQNPGTISMGHTFLDAYRATGNEYYYKAAEKAASAVIWGQSNEGGWNYMVDFAGDRSLKHWYNTIGKNGWRLEEFQHYYGNSTFDDDVTSDAARFLLRIYLEKLDVKYKPALDRAINFVLESQYPLGGWPQRYPLNHEFSKNGRPDYSSYYTYNDDVIWENINFLIQCYLTLGEERFLDPIIRGMNFYLISQHESGGWGQQYDMNLDVAGARSYEPRALLPGTTFENAMLLLRFYRITGNKRYMNQAEDAIAWLEQTRLPEESTEEGRYTHPTFVEVETGRPLYVHRRGSNVKYGYYYYDYDDERLLSHYGGKVNLPLEELRKEFKDLSGMSRADATINSPLKEGEFTKDETPQRYYDLSGIYSHRAADPLRIREILRSLDESDRWMTDRGMTSHPYIGDGQNQELTDEYASMHVGDDTDTSPYRDRSGQEYISTGLYIMNMRMLINFLNSGRAD